MSYLEIDYPADKTSFYKLLTEQLSIYTNSAPTPTAALANAAAVLHTALTDINWVGFYLVSGSRLVLGPFQGKPATMEIGIDQGVCGAAWREKKAQVVKDVHCFVGHIACDCSSSSELVLPVFAPDGEVLGVLDIDSTMPGRFDEEDAAGLALANDLLASWMTERS